MSTLEEHLLEALEPAGDQAQGRYVIQNDAEADWALRKIAKARKQKAEAQKLAEAEMLRIQDWLRSEEEKANRDEARFLVLLQEYHGKILAEDPKRKTLSLPAGKCQFRAQQPEFRRDAQALVVWLEAHGMTDFVKVKKEPDWAGFKTRVAVAGGGQVVDKETGEIVEGVTAEERPATFSVEVSE